MSDKMSEGEAVIKASDYLEAYKSYRRTDADVIKTKNAVGRWRVDFECGPDNEYVEVQMDQTTGELNKYKCTNLE